MIKFQNYCGSIYLLNHKSLTPTQILYSLYILSIYFLLLLFLFMESFVQAATVVTEVAKLELFLVCCTTKDISKTTSETLQGHI